MEGSKKTLWPDTEEGFDKKRRYLAILMEKGADRLILWGGQMGREELSGLTAGLVPIIAIDTAIEEAAENVTTVKVENEGEHERPFVIFSGQGESASDTYRALFSA